MSKKTVMITGANRGLGLGFAKHYLDKGWDVIATYRENAMGLTDIKNIKSFQMNVESEESINTTLDLISSKYNSIDLLINNAGRYGTGQSSIHDPFNVEDMVKTYRTNTMGPLLVTQAALPLLEKGHDKKVIHISSKVGSIADNSGGGSYGYRASKTALNMINQNLSIELKPKGILSVVMHPGWVQTDMGGPNALISIDESISAMTQTIDKFKLEHTGGFFERTGERIPF